MPFKERWRSIKKRCSSPKDKDFNSYGGRGITLCESWNTYENFYNWCIDTYEEGKTIDRIDNDGPYSPENCRWSSRAEQAKNRRITPLVKLSSLENLKKAHLVMHEKYGNPLVRTEKSCSHCRVIKNIKMFHKNKRRSDGLNAICRVCSAIERRKYYERERLQKKSNVFTKDT